MDIATGQDRAGSPVAIAATVAGNAPDSTIGPSGRVISFDPKMQNQRAALALVNGVVLVAWSSHEDLPPYHGWVMAFDATTLAAVGAFTHARTSTGGGVWQGGRAPTVDVNGFAYFATGNGKWDGTRNFANSLLKFRVDVRRADAGRLLHARERSRQLGDHDLSGSGFTLLPGTNLLLGGGKEGVLYLIDAASLGHKVVNDTQIVQRIPVQGGHVMGGPVFWNAPDVGPLVYNWSEDDVLRAYRLSDGRLTATYLQGQVVSPGHPGGSLTVSANGSAAASGIVWASMPTSQDGVHGLVAGVLRAFNAETLQEIWNSEQNIPRDRVGTLMKFVPPVVANGRVFLPNQNNQIAVYGLLPADFTVTATPGARVIPPGGVATFLGDDRDRQRFRRSRGPDRERSAGECDGLLHSLVSDRSGNIDDDRRDRGGAPASTSLLTVTGTSQGARANRGPDRAERQRYRGQPGAHRHQVRRQQSGRDGRVRNRRRRSHLQLEQRRRASRPRCRSRWSIQPARRPASRSRGRRTTSG